jgi:exosortase A
MSESVVLARPDPAGAEALPTSAPLAGAWRQYGVVWVAVVAAILGLLHKDTVHLVTRWWRSETYGHCLLILPIIFWLIWQRRAGLARLAPRPWAWGAAGVLAAGIVWMVGELAGVALLRHAGVVLSVIATVPAIFGPAVARGVMFPLGFALFLIPAGEQLENPMQTVTAHMAVWMLRVTGVPTHMDGVFISIPNGDFEVAEACSGVRFLIAMVAFGALVANVCFKSPKRRMWFMAASVAIPVVANSIRVWGTIYAAFLTTPEVARGIDHVVYGWVFFAIVMVLLLAVSWRFFDRPVDDPFIDPAELQRPGTAPGPRGKLAAVALLTLGAGALAPAWAGLSAAASGERRTAALQLNPPAGWTPTAYNGFPWKPRYLNPSAELFQTYRDPGGATVDLYVAVYDRQGEGREVVRYGQGAFDPIEKQGWAWASNAPAPPGAAASQINRSATVRDVVQYYLVNGKLVGSPYLAKIEGLKARLVGGDPRAATVIVSAERTDPLTSARPQIDRLLHDLGPIDQLIDRAVVPAAR